MSSRDAREQEEEEEEEEEDFYDCQEINPDKRGEDQETKGGDANTDRLMDKLTETEPKEGLQDQGLQDQELQDQNLQYQELQDQELQDQGLQDQELQDQELQDQELQDQELQDQELQDQELQDLSDSELKEVEFDEDYLREVEKELTEQDKESRRQQSLTLKERGNAHFKSGDWKEAEQSYTEALSQCPVCFCKDRAVLFSNRAAARLHLDLKDQAISDCNKAIQLNPDYVRALLRRAELFEQTEKLDEALEDYTKVLDLDHNCTTAKHACMRLPRQIQERNEKLKEEMMSKLKDLGNLVLRPFGLSTSNFQVNQDSSTGSYSINFVQNPNNNNT